MGSSTLTVSHPRVCPPSLPQMVQYEVTRKELMDKQQRKIDELERRAKALEKQKAENEAAWIEKQREFELTKVTVI